VLLIREARASPGLEAQTP